MWVERKGIGGRLGKRFMDVRGRACEGTRLGGLWVHGRGAERFGGRVCIWYGLVSL